LTNHPQKPTAVIMAKYPTPGKVNTRLITDSFTDQNAAAVATAFLQCITARLHKIFHGNIIIATSPDHALPQMKQLINKRLPDQAPSIPILPQGQGNLGNRIQNIWLKINKKNNSNQTPICFFGMDSPDIPTRILKELYNLLSTTPPPFDIAAGPTDDGGYWTLAAHEYHPEILQNINWGENTVYQNTKKIAESANLRFDPLKPWFDIDTPEDLEKLMQRLNASLSTLSENAQTHTKTAHPKSKNARIRLHKNLLKIMKNTPDNQ